jgi:hypothetical protein
MGDGLEILPKTVREILKADNNEILRLCKEGKLPLKQNAKGLTYFTTEDVKTLKKLQEIQNKASGQELKNGKKGNVKKEIKGESPAQKQLPVEQKKMDETIVLLKQITGAVKNIETGVYNKFANLLEEKLETKLEEKLGGIDAVIMDLVRCKVEADDMRRKLAQNDKEIYTLKNELSCYKKFAGNIYIKKNIEDAFDF